MLTKLSGEVLCRFGTSSLIFQGNFFEQPGTALSSCWNLFELSVDVVWIFYKFSVLLGEVLWTFRGSFLNFWGKFTQLEVKVLRASGESCLNFYYKLFGVWARFSGLLEKIFRTSGVSSLNFRERAPSIFRGYSKKVVWMPEVDSPDILSKFSDHR